MKDEPDIVKELRELDLLGKLRKKSGKLFYFHQAETVELSDEEEGYESPDFSKIKLDEIKENYLSIFENLFVAITIADEKERIVSWNKYAEDLLKMSEKDLFLRNVRSLYPEEEWKKIRSQNVRQKGIKHKIETKIIRKDGKLLDVEISLSVLKGEGGKITGSIGLIKDNSKLKDIEHKLKDVQEKYKTIFENSAVGIMLTDEKERIVSWNRYAEKILEMNEDDLYLKPVSILYPVNEWEKIRSENIRSKGMQHHLETKILKKNKKLIDVDLSISVLKNHEGKIVGSIGIIKDITDQKKIKQELVESEEKFRRIFDATSDILLYLNDEVIIDINKTALNFLGLKKEEVIGKKISDLKSFCSNDVKKHITAIKKASNGEIVNDYECTLKTRDEIEYRMLFSVDTIEEDGALEGILLRGRDITRRQRAWEELLKLEEKYRVLAETSADGVITLDPIGRITYVNPAFEKMINRRKGEILATLFRDYLSEDSIYFFQQVLIDVRKKDEKIENIELELLRSGGDLVPIEINIAPLKKNNTFAGIICSIRDITERRLIENELKKSERLKTEFMNIAAHELKSPVTPIKGYLELIIADKEATEKIKNWAKISLRNSERLLRLVNDILDVSRLDTDTMRFEMIKLNPVEILNEIIEDMRPAVEKKNLKFITKIPEDLPNIMGDRHRLSQVLKNLIGNALKFTDNGHISITAKKEKDHILIAIEDTGIGISKDEIKKIFTKFYQAYSGDDRKNEGVGLGLFICREIIKKHNGEIWAESKLGKGSTFFIKLPYIHKIIIAPNKK